MASISSTSATTSTSYKRITGLATGMDTDAMVKQAMQAYQLKVDQAKQARDLQVFKQTLYRDAIKDLRGIFTKYTDISKPDSLLLTKNYGTSKFTSTNEGAVTAEGLPGAIIGKYKIEVQGVAKPATIEFKDIEKFQNTKVNINVSGKEVEIDLTGITDTDTMITKMNNDMKASGVEAKFSKSSLTGKVFLTSNKTGEGQNISIYTYSDKGKAVVGNISYEDILDKKLNFNINDTNVEVDLSNIEVDEEDPITAAEKKKQLSLEKLRVSLSDYGVDVTVNEDKLYFSTKAGEEYSLEVSADGTLIGNAIDTNTGEPIVDQVGKASGYTSGKTKLEDLYTEEELVINEGSNGKVIVTDTFNQTKEIPIKLNEITIDEVKFKISDVTTSPVTVSGTTDTSKLVDKLKEFVKDYNEVISKITTKLNEKKDLNYKPLTQEQKADMTEDQIKKWEDKVKQGLLKRDSDLTNITSQLRSAFYDSIKGTNLNIKTLGIDFSSDIEKSGQLVIDEEKLTTALGENSEDVVKLFTQAAPSGMTDKKEIYNNSGIFQRIKTILNDSVMTSASPFLKRVGYEGTSTYSNNDITNDLLKRERQISLMESNLSDRETRLYQKFATLEKVMNNYNSQSSWLMQQFSGA